MGFWKRPRFYVINHKLFFLKKIDNNYTDPVITLPFIMKPMEFIGKSHNTLKINILEEVYIYKVIGSHKKSKKVIISHNIYHKKNFTYDLSIDFL